jgi:multiple sugar transport system substrate-binding protein
MKKRSTLIAAMAVTTAIAASLAGCSSGSDGSGHTTITVGYSGGGVVDTYMKQIIADAQKALPDVTIKTAVYPTYDDEQNQLSTQFAAGTAPDVILWDNSAPIAQFATEGAIQPVDDQIKGTEVDLSLYPKALVDGWRIDGKLYSVPSYLQNSGIAYNQDVLAAAGVTTMPDSTAAMADAAAKVHAATGKPGVVLLDNLFHLTQYALAFDGGWGYGKTIDSAQNIAGMDYLLGLFASGDAQTAKQLGATWDGEALAGGKAAMSDAGPWYIGFMSTTAPNVKYALEAMPSSTAGSPFVATYGGGFSISAKTKDAKAAGQVIAKLTDKASQEAILTTKLGYVPAMSSYADQYRADTPQYAAFTTKVLADGKGLDYPTKTTEFGNDLVNGFEQLVAAKSTSSKSLLQDLQKKYGK